MSIETVFSWLTTATWKGSLLIAAILITQTVLRRWIPAGWRHALLLVCFIRLVVPVAPSSAISVFNLAQSSDPAPFIRIIPVEAGDTSPIVIPRTFAASVQSKSADPITIVLVSIWALGALLIAGRVLRRSLLIAQRLREVSEVSTPEALALVDSARAAIGVKRRVRLATTNAVDAPSLHGWLRPVLLLPPQILESFSPDQLRFIFLHEIAHLRRADVPLNWFIAAVQAIHWFNPLVWLAVTRLHEDRELACDALALSRVEKQERTAYGQTVLRLLDQFRTPALVPGLVGMSSTHDQVKRRILMIATFRNRSRYSLLFGAATLAVALVTLTDARAGERHVFRRQLQPMSAEASAYMKQLEVRMTLDLVSASVDQVLGAISARTGVSIDASGIDAETRAARLTLKAADLPAHLLLTETLASLDLTVEFTATGAVVKKAEAHEDFTDLIPAHGTGSAQGERHVIFINKNGDVDVDVPHIDPDDIVVEKDRVVIKRIDIRKHDDEAAAGVSRRKLKIHGENGAPAGTLEIEVQKAP
jgi:bla regulator protein blaR1